MLERSLPFPVCRVYMGLWPQRSPVRNRRRIPGLALVRLFVVEWGRYLLAQYHQARGRLVVFDRYPYDALLPVTPPATRRARFVHWILGHACPDPDLAIVLDAPGHVLHARKPEHAPEYLEAQRQGYLGLRQRKRGIVVVDATRTAEDVCDEVASLIHETYRRRRQAGS